MNTTNMRSLNCTWSRGGTEVRPRALLSLILPLAGVLSFGILHGQDTMHELALVISATHGEQDAEVITPERLSAMLDTGNVFVFDCNEPEIYAEAHVPGAVLIVYDEVNGTNLPKDHGATLVFYCYSPECPAGTNASKTALQLGFTHVYSMLAGITGWQDAKLRTEP